MRVDAGVASFADAHLGPFSGGVDSHAASFPSPPMENDDGEALAGHATFTEK